MPPTNAREDRRLVFESSNGKKTNNQAAAAATPPPYTARRPKRSESTGPRRDARGVERGGDRQRRGCEAARQPELRRDVRQQERADHRIHDVGPEARRRPRSTSRASVRAHTSPSGARDRVLPASAANCGVSLTPSRSHNPNAHEQHAREQRQAPAPDRELVVGHQLQRQRAWCRSRSATPIDGPICAHAALRPR